MLRKEEAIWVESQKMFYCSTINIKFCFAQQHIVPSVHIVHHSTLFSTAHHIVQPLQQNLLQMLKTWHHTFATLSVILRRECLMGYLALSHWNFVTAWDRGSKAKESIKCNRYTSKTYINHLLTSLFYNSGH